MSAFHALCFLDSHDQAIIWPLPRSERSAGFVIFHVDAQTRERRYLLLDYGRYWDFPKGHLEPGESDLAAAVRELEEETGITDITRVEGFAREINYFYHANGTPMNKSVIFFLAETDDEEIRLSHEHVGGAYFKFDDAIRKLKYPNAREVLRAAEVFLDG